jgi:hypothetical protein
MREETHACLCAQPGHWFGPVTRLGLLGSAQPHGSSWTQPPKKTSNIVVFLYFFCDFFLYFYIVKIQISYLEYLVFNAMWHIYICLHAYGQYPNMFWTFCYKKNIGSFKNVFSHGFLKHNKKNIFVHFWILQHVYKTPKGIGQYFKKYKKSYFRGNSSIIHVNVWIRKS